MAKLYSWDINSTGSLYVGENGGSALSYDQDSVVTFKESENFLFIETEDAILKIDISNRAVLVDHKPKKSIET